MRNLDLLSQELPQILETARARLQIPGVALGLIVGDNSLTVVDGVTSIEHPLPIDPGTLFQIGSVTKTVTALALLRLHNEGLVDLDTPVRHVLPALRLAREEVARVVTLRHLLTHTAGWDGDDLADPGDGDDALAKTVVGMADLPQRTSLGQVYSYNNAAYYLAGRVIEVVTGRAYEAAVRELVLRPLGMNHSFFAAADVITHRVAVGHHVADERPVVARPWSIARGTRPAAGLVSCVEDLLRYARFFLRKAVSEDGRRLLREATLREMQEPHVSTGGIGQARAIAWLVRSTGGLLSIEHGGSTNGQSSLLVLVPERTLAVVILSNGSRGGTLAEEMQSYVLRTVVGVTVDREPDAMVPPANRHEYVGRYETLLWDFDLRLTDGQLSLQVIPNGGYPTKESPPDPPLPPVRLTFTGPDRVVVADPPLTGLSSEFLRDEAGAVSWFRCFDRVASRRVEKGQAPGPERRE